MKYPPLEIDWACTDFLTYVRSDFENDTREEVLSVLAKHFGLEEDKQQETVQRWDDEKRIELLYQALGKRCKGIWEPGGNRMEEKVTGRRGKVLSRTIGIIVTGILPIVLLTGCSRERRETRREIDRIYHAAEQTAEDRAAAYIAEKYGIDALTEGYWVQGHHDFFAPEINSNVVVFMEYEGRKFCTGLDVDDETVLWDNYQREEIDAVLQEYFTEQYRLPQPYKADTRFWLENTPDYHAVTPAEWRERGYDHGNMVDFYFQGQTAEELLAKIHRLEFYDSWLPMEQELASLSLEAENWPVCEGGSVEWNLRIYDSPEAEYVDRSVEYPDIAGFPYFREWRRACITDRGTKEEELSGESWSFRSVQKKGIMVISRLPFEIEDILFVSEAAEEWNVEWGDSKGQSYRPVSDIYEVTEESPDSYYATVMQVPTDFAAGYEGALYILSRNKETGKVKIMKYISSQEELDALPEEESNRDYKTYSNGTCGMSAGFQYVVAERIEEEEE